MIRAAFLALLSHWLRHPLQLVTLAVGLALATGLWSAVQAINSEARASYKQAEEQLAGMAGARLVPMEGSISLEQFAHLRRAGWQVTPVLTGNVKFREQAFDIMGIDLLSHPLSAALITEQGAPDLTALTPPGLLFAHPDTAARLAFLSDSPPLRAVEDVPRDLLIADLSLASRLLNQSHQISYLQLLPTQRSGLQPRAELVPELRLDASGDAADTARLTESFHLNLTAFGLLSFAVGLFIVQGGIALSLEQRRAMLRTLRGLGLSLRLIVLLIAAELMAIGILSALLGLTGGYLVAAALLPDVSATLSGLYGAQIDGGLELRPSWVLSGLGMALAGIFVAGAQALYEVWQMPLLAAPASQARGQHVRRSYRLLAIAGVALLLLGAVILLVSEGLLGGFAFLSALMLGAALLLPQVITLLLTLAQRFTRGPFAGWLLADTRAQLPGMSLALMALLLALAANIGVTTMVSSFRLTFTAWLDQRLAAELYVTVQNDHQGAALQDWLAARDIPALPVRRADLRYEGLPLRVYGVVDHATYRDHWPLLDAKSDAWDRMFRHGAAMINEQMARRHGLKPGDDVALQSGWRAEVVGIYSDFGNPDAQAIVALPTLLAQIPGVPNRQFGLRVPEEEIFPVSKAIRDAFDLPADAITDQRTIKMRSLAIFERTFVITAALNLLTLGVAGFAMLSSLLTLWAQRLPQLAPVWAMGLTRRQLAATELLRSLLLATMTALLALPLGLALAWALLAVINVAAFGWKLPMYLFPADWLQLFLLALLAAALSAALPAWRLSRLDPADLLKVFANER